MSVVTLHGNGDADDSLAIRALLHGFPAFDTRIGIDIVAPTFVDLPPGVYRVMVPSQWPLDPSAEGWARRHQR